MPISFHLPSKPPRPGLWIHADKAARRVLEQPQALAHHRQAPPPRPAQAYPHPSSCFSTVGSWCLCSALPLPGSSSSNNLSQVLVLLAVRRWILYLCAEGVILVLLVALDPVLGGGGPRLCVHLVGDVDAVDPEGHELEGQIVARAIGGLHAVAVVVEGVVAWPRRRCGVARCRERRPITSQT